MKLNQILQVVHDMQSSQSVIKIEYEKKTWIFFNIFELFWIILDIFI